MPHGRQQGSCKKWADCRCFKFNGECTCGADCYCGNVSWTDFPNTSKIQKKPQSDPDTSRKEHQRITNQKENESLPSYSFKLSTTMHCKGCSDTIENALLQQSGVADVYTCLKSQTVTVALSAAYKTSSVNGQRQPKNLDFSVQKRLLETIESVGFMAMPCQTSEFTLTYTWTKVSNNSTNSTQRKPKQVKHLRKKTKRKTRTSKCARKSKDKLKKTQKLNHLLYRSRRFLNACYSKWIFFCESFGFLNGSKSKFSRLQVYYSSISSVVLLFVLACLLFVWSDVSLHWNADSKMHFAETAVATGSASIIVTNDNDLVQTSDRQAVSGGSLFSNEADWSGFKELEIDNVGDLTFHAWIQCRGMLGLVEQNMKISLTEAKDLSICLDSWIAVSLEDRRKGLLEHNEGSLPTWISELIENAFSVAKSKLMYNSCVRFDNMDAYDVAEFFCISAIQSSTAEDTAMMYNSLALVLRHANKFSEALAAQRVAAQQQPQNKIINGALNELRLASVTQRNGFLSSLNQTQMGKVMAQVAEIEFMHPRGDYVRFQPGKTNPEDLFHPM